VEAVGERSRLDGMLPDGLRSRGRNGLGEVTSGLEGRLGFDLEFVRGLCGVSCVGDVGGCVEEDEKAALWSWGVEG
jgi:hypothetical protein